jgi:hypothetical protein
MKFYRSLSAPGYQWVFPVNPTDHARFGALDGTPRLVGWNPLPVFLKQPEDDPVLLGHADLPPAASGSSLVFSQRARDVLEETVGPDAEFLPLDCEQEPLWLLNVVRVVDALNSAKSSVVTEPSGPWLRQAVFRESALRGVRVFRLPPPLGDETYLSRRVVRLIEEQQLNGLDFTTVWDSEAGVRRERPQRSSLFVDGSRGTV